MMKTEQRALRLDTHTHTPRQGQGDEERWRKSVSQGRRLEEDSRVLYLDKTTQKGREKVQLERYNGSLPSLLSWLIQDTTDLRVVLRHFNV